ncbi:(ZYRO0F13464g) [Zygosaccharomyces parabailii]|uniref:ZYBA0S03-11650g1_1 n=1 Tax=Zygosaccharomyces bailii (strain CLIB 213 / ATCC 58445 / CBS 680 / BCRC 21525 / NBRC 1098 / NCYC 1416 / NRRL Y-2227) TaxID=1333698 RepID=A0A8J2T8I2_ZYGB2|nr:(ZYRO0F13464g) [Zygosaccharomyces parabailii]CDF89205.1 ZYBA0S03-11650g1_1 [Zygosaccharomyces bailii CLIB 213]CDH16298.1 uncharacterized protein ZBAI_08086 [Zygosaccharomyces bailii ISA1307]
MYLMTQDKLRKGGDPNSEQSSGMENKLTFARPKKGPTNVLYKNLMGDKSLVRNVSFECANSSLAFTLNSGSKSDLRLVIGDELSKNDNRKRNPMSHFENNMNDTMRPRCPKYPVANKKYEDCRDDTSEDEIDELLRRELAEAFENDMFQRGGTFDNKWDDCNFFSCLPNNSNLNDPSSPHSKTSIDNDTSFCLGSRLQKEPEAFNLPVCGITETVDNAGLRFQLKQETWKLKSEMMGENNTTNSNKDDFCQASDEERTLTKTKYWTTNVDMQTKWAAEKLSRDWQTVRRFSLDPSGMRSKPLASRVKCICSEDGFQGRRLEIIIQDKFSSAPPLLRKVNTTAASAELSDYMESVVKTRNKHQESALQAIEDESLRDCLLIAKDNSNKIWSDSEKLEFA